MFYLHERTEKSRHEARLSHLRRLFGAAEDHSDDVTLRAGDVLLVNHADDGWFTYPQISGLTVFRFHPYDCPSVRDKPEGVLPLDWRWLEGTEVSLPLLVERATKRMQRDKQLQEDALNRQVVWLVEVDGQLRGFRAQEGDALDLAQKLGGSVRPLKGLEP